MVTKTFLKEDGNKTIGLILLLLPLSFLSFADMVGKKNFSAQPNFYPQSAKQDAIQIQSPVAYGGKIYSMTSSPARSLLSGFLSPTF